MLTDVTGWDTNILTLYNVSISDNDDYRCVATNASGSSFSYYATLLIEGMYVCTQQNYLENGLRLVGTYLLCGISILLSFRSVVGALGPTMEQMGENTESKYGHE